MAPSKKKKVTNFNSHFWSCCLAIFESKTKTLKAFERLSWMTFQPVCWPMLTLPPLPLIVQCCGTPQNADNDYLSLAKFTRLGPLEPDPSRRRLEMLRMLRARKIRNLLSILMCPCFFAVMFCFFWFRHVRRFAVAIYFDFFGVCERARRLLVKCCSRLVCAWAVKDTDSHVLRLTADVDFSRA